MKWPNDVSKPKRSFIGVLLWLWFFFWVLILTHSSIPLWFENIIRDCWVPRVVVIEGGLLDLDDYWLWPMPVEIEGKERRGATESDIPLTKMIFCSFFLLPNVKSSNIQFRYQ
jgi:hypothetical protein